MTENSRFWDGHITGDASEAPYNAATEFSRVLASLTNTGFGNMGGVFFGEGNNLVVTGAATPISIASGAGIVYGAWYQNTAAVSKSVTVPAGLRGDLVVLRKDWAAQTVRIEVVEGTDGGADATLTQTIGILWEIPLAYMRNNAGAITITDMRKPVGGAGMYKLDEVDPTGTNLIEFSNIPGGFKALKLVIAGQHSHSVNNISFYLNGDNAGTSYDFNRSGLQSHDTLASDDYPGEPYVGRHAASTSDCVEITLPNYADKSANRVIQLIGTGYAPGSGGGETLIGGVWLNTADIVTKVSYELTDGGHTFTTGSYATLYGLI
jgi:hypothetical protein